MSGRSHFAAPMLLGISVAMIAYASLYPFRLSPEVRSVAEALSTLGWARASRADMFNNVLLYLPFGFCMSLIVEPRYGRLRGILAALVGGALLSLSMELAQASIAPRVPSLTDLSLNIAGALAGGIAGSAWQALGGRMTPKFAPKDRSGAVALAILVLWFVARLWPLIPDPSLRQLKQAARPLFTPRLDLTELSGFFVGWLVVAQAVFHLARQQRAVDGFLLVIAAVLVGRTVIAGNTLIVAELAALALLLPALVMLSQLEDRARSTLIAATLGLWLAWLALRGLDSGAGPEIDLERLSLWLRQGAPPAPQLAAKAFAYTSLAWLLAVAGLRPRVAASLMIVFVTLLCLLQAGVATPSYGWLDFVLAVIGALLVARWMPAPTRRTSTRTA
jgi:glycopeptide antibiotics resistance protein